MQKEKNLMKNTAIFAVGNLGSQLINFILVPIYTFFLTTEEMGVYDIAITTVSLFAPLIVLNIYEGTYRWLLDDRYSKEKIVTNSFMIWSVSLVILGIPVVLLLNRESEINIYIQVLLLCSSTLNITLQFITRGLRNHILYAFQGIVNALIKLLSGTVLMIVFDMKYVGLFIGCIIANFSTSILMIIKQKIEKFIKLDEKDCHFQLDILKYAIALVPNSICWWIMAFADRYFLKYYIGSSANGIYAVSNKFPSLMQLVTNFFYLAWQEQAIDEFGEKERNVYYTKIFALYSKFLLTALLVLIPISKLFIVSFMSQEYIIAGDYVAFMMIGSVFNAFAAFYGTGYTSSKRTGGAFATTILGAGVNITVNILLIPSLGVQAASLSTMLAYLTIWLVRIVQLKQVFCIDIHWKFVASLIGIALLISVLIIYCSIVGLCILTLLGIVSFLVLNRSMIKEILVLIKKKVFVKE